MAERLTPQDVIRAVVAAGGRTKLVAERLGMREGDVISAITAEQSSLAEQLRTAFLLQLYDTMMLTQAVFMSHLDHMSPGDVARAYTAQSQSFAALTARPSEDAAEQPVDIQMARNNLMARLDNYAERKANSASKEEAVSE